MIDGEDGPDGGEAVDVVGPVQGVEADDEVALLLGLHFDHVVHLLGNYRFKNEARYCHFFHLLLPTRFPAAGLSASHVCADWLHDWGLAAKWARLLIIYLVAA